jgi:hypothetical protein
MLLPLLCGRQWLRQLGALLLLAGPLLAQRPTQSVPHSVALPPESRTLEFIENQGQWDARARYAAVLPGGRLFLEKDAFTYNFVTGRPSPHGRQPAAKGRQSAAPFRAHAVRVQFESASPDVKLAPEAPTGSVHNYLHGSDRARWGRHARGFRALRYAGLWPGIGLHVYENAGQKLEYDFDLAAHADPTLLRLRYEGADQVQLRPDGSLEVKTSAGSFREAAPVAFQLDATGRRQSVACAYELHGHTLRFRLGPYDDARPLTIDPTVEFASFTGSTADNWGFTATYDQQGNLYSGGIAFNAGYPTSPGAYDPAFSGTVDMALIKYNPAVSGPAALVWSTYLGGIGAEFPHSLVANERGELVIMGTTSSADYPTTDGAYDDTFNGGKKFAPFGPYDQLTMLNGADLIVSRLSASGDELLASTFLGGSDNDGVLDPESPAPRLVHNYGDYFRGDVLLDATGNVYLATSTASADFPTPAGFDNHHEGNTDAVVCKFTADLRTLSWSSLLGGSGADAAYSVQLDKTGNVYVAGGTTSTDLPVDAGAYQPQLGGNVDAFVARVSADGQSLQKATYLGTAAYDQAYFLQLDLAGEVYLLGQTRGQLAISPGRYGVPNSGQYVQKLSTDLDQLRFSTVFGSGRGLIDLSPTAFLVDQCDRVYISGWGGNDINGARFGFDNGNTARLPLTPNALQKTTDSADFYLAQFSPGMRSLEYATYLGNNDPNEGDHVDGGTSRFDPQGIVYQAVCACGEQGGGFPIPPGANTYQAKSGFFNCNNAAFKMRFETVFATTGTDSLACADGPPVRLLGSPGGGIWTGPGVSGSLANGYFFTPAPSLIGVQTLTYTVSGIAVCQGTASLRLRVVPVPLTSIVAPSQTTLCPDSPPIRLTGSPAGGTFSGPGIRNGNIFDPQIARPGANQVTYTYQHQASPNITCPGTATLTLLLLPPLVATSADTLACAGGPPVQLLGSPAGGVWSGPGVSGSAASGYVFTPDASLAGPRILTYSSPGSAACNATATLRVRVVALPTVSISAPSGPLCPDSAPITLTGSPAGGTFSGTGISNGTSFDPRLAGPGQHQLIYTYISPTEQNIRCPASAAITLVVSPRVAIQLPPDTVLCPGSSPAFRLRAAPGGGSWTGEGVSGSVATGFFFTPPANLSGRQATLSYSISGGICNSTAQYHISGAVAPLLSALWEPIACPDNRVAPLRLRFSTASMLNNSTAGTVTWEFGDGSPPVTTTTFNAVEHTYVQAGLYQPYATLYYLSSRCQTTVSPPAVTVKESCFTQHHHPQRRPAQCHVCPGSSVRHAPTRVLALGPAGI